MKIVFVFFLLAFGYVFSLWKFGGMDKTVLNKLDQQYQYEQKALSLARENRFLKTKISDLKYEVSQLDSKNRYLAAQAEGKTPAAATVSRTIASVPKTNINDLVSYEVYKWTPEKLLAIGEKELHFKNYEKSAQFYNELLDRFPDHQIVSDRVLFGAGVAAFETGKRYDWTEKHLSRLVKNHPKSEFYRGAKLWLALAHYNQGDHQKFLTTVEEFRLKYRNTEEWKILSRYYEDISYKIKK
ncbi:MAG TPA: tetratricopeptide repeat protein [Bacteriovoracaceae bacterium]|nr:tetratricopeptide repeat protein [Bacteriovoracaceae bacterium]